MFNTTAAKLREQLDAAAGAAAAEIVKDPGNAGRVANSLANRLGSYDAAKLWETELEGIERFAEGKDWDVARLSAVKHRVLLQMALRPADDHWSGRGNDERRSYADGRREYLNDVYNGLAYEYNQALGVLDDAGMN